MTNAVAVFNAAGALTHVFNTIQAAVNAASAGSTIFLSAGTFTESVVIDKALNFQGAGAGQTIISPPSGDGFLITGNIGAAATVAIDGIEFEGSVDGSGVRFNDGAVLGTLSITDSLFDNNFRNGVQIGGGNNPIDLGNVIITDTDFNFNGRPSTSSGDGDILFFQYNGDATISNVNITGSAVAAGAAENAIQFRSNTGSLGNVSLSDINISGNYEKQPIAFFNYDDISGLSATNVVVTADSASFQLAANFDDIGGNIDFAALGIDITGSPDPVALQGDATSQTISSGAENAILRGAGGNDALNGGEGTDTAVYRGDLSTFTIATSIDGNGAVSIISVTDNNAAADGDEGTDTLSGVENLLFKGNVLLSTEANVLVFDAANNLLGTFSTIQAGVNAAVDGGLVLINEGTYAEQVSITGMTDLTVRGVGNVVITSPATLAATSTSSSGRAVHALVNVVDGTNVVLKDLTVDGAGITAGLIGDANNVGVVYRNASGGLENVHVEGIRDAYEAGTTAGGKPVLSGLQRGVGVQVDNDDPGMGALNAFFMHGGSITDFQKNATVFGYADLDITGVTVAGGGAQTIIAQNGFQAFNSTGSIDGNTITEIGYAGPAFAYSGLFLGFDNTDLSITENVITGTNTEDLNSKTVGVFIFNDLGANSGGVISGNTISDVDTGVGIYGPVNPNGILVFDNEITLIDVTDPFAAGVDHQPQAGDVVDYILHGSNFTDSLFGADGADNFAGFGGNDLIDTAGGDDTLRGGAGLDTLNGGDGIDTADFSDAAGGMLVDLIVGQSQSGGTLQTNGTYTGGTVEDTISGIENLIGTAFNDRLVTNIDGSVIDGGAGNDRIVTLGNGSTLIGDLGRDTIEGGNGADDITGGVDVDSLLGGGGADTIDAGIGADVARGGEGADLIFGGDGIDKLFGDAGDDTMEGGLGNDNLSGGGGNDRLIGNAGTDKYTLSTGNDTVVFALGDGADTVTDFDRSGNDVIELQGFGAAFDDLADILAATTVSGTAVIIAFGGGDQLRLNSTTLASLTADDFLFV